jgi:hypothetical protein
MKFSAYLENRIFSGFADGRINPLSIKWVSEFSQMCLRSKTKEGRHNSMAWSIDFGLGGPQFESRRRKEKMSIAFIYFLDEILIRGMA